MKKIIETERGRVSTERNEKVCCGCGQSKDIGLVVCWTCFKQGDNPFKYFDGTLEEWLEKKTI